MPPISSLNLNRPGSIYQFLDSVGDGSGTKNLIGNYSSAATPFWIIPQSDEILLEIRRVIVQVEDAGSVDAGGYGNGSALTNGIKIVKRSGANNVITQDLTNGLPVKTNAHWARFCYDVKSTSWGSGNNYVSARWTFGKSGKNIVLDRKFNESLAVILNDDLSGLISHTFMVQGFIRSKKNVG